MSETITSKVAAGRLGMKTGAGLFEYSPEEAAALRQQRAQKLVAVRKALSE